MWDISLHLIYLLAATWAMMALLGGVIYWMSMRLKGLHARQRRLFDGTSGDAGGMEEILLQHVEQIRCNERALQEITQQADSNQSRLQQAVQHVGLVRYNPFRDTGGHYSFALCLADAEGNGVILSSLHGRGETRLYAKPLRAWTSALPLGDEEAEALRLSREDQPDALESEIVSTGTAL